MIDSVMKSVWLALKYGHSAKILGHRNENETSNIENSEIDWKL